MPVDYQGRIVQLSCAAKERNITAITIAIAQIHLSSYAHLSITALLGWATCVLKYPSHPFGKLRLPPPTCLLTGQLNRVPPAQLAFPSGKVWDSDFLVTP